MNNPGKRKFMNVYDQVILHVIGHFEWGNAWCWAAHGKFSFRGKSSTQTLPIAKRCEDHTQPVVSCALLLVFALPEMGEKITPSVFCQAKMGSVSPDHRTFTKEQYMGRLSARKLSRPRGSFVRSASFSRYNGVH